MSNVAPVGSRKAIDREKVLITTAMIMISGNFLTKPLPVDFNNWDSDYLCKWLGEHSGGVMMGEAGWVIENLLTNIASTMANYHERSVGELNEQLNREIDGLTS